MPDSIQKQNIPLSKILDFPGLAFGKFSDKSLGGLVSSLQSKGIEEPLIVRQGKDGEYELIAGYRRRRAGELAKLSDVPAYVVELDDKQAKECYWWSNSGSSETLEAFIKRLKERDAEPKKRLPQYRKRRISPLKNLTAPPKIRLRAQHPPLPLLLRPKLPRTKRRKRRKPLPKSRRKRQRKIR